MTIPEDVLTLLVHSSFLDLNAFVLFHIALKRSYSYMDMAYSTAGSYPFGPARLRFWSRCVDVDVESGFLLEITVPQMKSLRRRPKMELTHAKFDERANEFRKYLEFAEVFDNTNSRSIGQSGEIHRDICRTVPGHIFFQNDHSLVVGQRMLGRVLQAVALACPDVGYCQGMNFVAVTLIIGALDEQVTGGFPADGSINNISDNMIDNDNSDDDNDNEEKEEEDEEGGQGVSWKYAKAIANLRRLMDNERQDCEFEVYLLLRKLIHKGSKFSMLGMWTIGTPRMKMRVYQLDRIMSWTLPRLQHHFETIGMQPEILVSQWLMTLFSYTLPLSLTLRLWDFIFLGGWPGVFRISVAILSVMEAHMLQLDLDGFGKMMRTWKQKGNIALAGQSMAAKILKVAHDTIVTEEVLAQLQENYAMEMISMSEVTLAAEESRLEEEQQRQSDDKDSNKNLVDRAGNRVSRFFKDIASAVDDNLTQIAEPQSPSTTKGQQSLGQLTGRESTHWLLRYGNRLSPESAKEMCRVRDALKELEITVDRDKQKIQSKILLACDVSREASNDLEKAQAENSKVVGKVTRLEDQYGFAMEEASCLSEKAMSEIRKFEEEFGEEDSYALQSYQKNMQQERAKALQEEKTRRDSKRKEKRRKQKRGMSFRSSIDKLWSSLSSSSSSTTKGTDEDVVDDANDNDAKKEEEEEAEEEEEREDDDDDDDDDGDDFEGSGGMTCTEARIDYESPIEPSWTPFAPFAKLYNSIISAGRAVVSSSKNKDVSEIHKSASLRNVEEKLNNRLLKIAVETQKCQQIIIQVTRQLRKFRSRLAETESWLASVKLSLEEAEEWKNSLCDQLQLLVEDTNRGRSQKLQYISNEFYY